MLRDLEDKRREYARGKLEKKSLPENPMELFSLWMDEAMNSGNPDPTAMTLSTVERNGQPFSRIVLLKKIDQDRLIFYTNYHSRKAREIRNRSKVAVHFYWPELERQVNISGIARPVEDRDSDSYFQSRPYNSKLSAWASPQGEEVPNRDYLEHELGKYRQKYNDPDNVPRPAYWGGYAIIPSRIEFWQGRRNRMHDRIEFTRKEERWKSIRLAP